MASGKCAFLDLAASYTHYTKRRGHIASIVLSPSQHSGNLIGFERQIREFVKNLLLTLLTLSLIFSTYTTYFFKITSPRQ
jgi:hypothetical protein